MSLDLSHSFSLSFDSPVGGTDTKGYKIIFTCHFYLHSEWSCPDVPRGGESTGTRVVVYVMDYIVRKKCDD